MQRRRVMDASRLFNFAVGGTLQRLVRVFRGCCRIDIQQYRWLSHAIIHGELFVV